MVREAHPSTNCQLALAHACVWAGIVNVSWTLPNTQWALIIYRVTVSILVENGCLTQIRQQFPHMPLRKGIADVKVSSASMSWQAPKNHNKAELHSS